MMGVCLVVEVMCGLVLAAQSVRHMNACTHNTWMAYPLVWTALGGGGVALAWGGLSGDVPSDWRIALLMLSMTVLTVIDERRKK